jgi:hypothetical protein
MGHGYNAIVGYGILINFEDFIYDVDDNEDPFYKLELLESNTEFNDLLINYNNYSDDTSGLVFITIRNKSKNVDIRGDYGTFHKIDNSKMKPTKEEFGLLLKARTYLVGDKIIDINFGMFTYEAD